MTDKTSYNILALKGAGVDDMEYVETFGMDPSTAYTPEINTAMLDKVYQENMDHYATQGLSEEEATKNANAKRAAAERDIKELMAKKGLLKK